MTWNGSPTPPGTPVRGTSKRRHRPWKINPANAGKASGVSGSSRILPNRYVDEGDKGTQHRKAIRSAERRQWLREASADF